MVVAMLVVFNGDAAGCGFHVMSMAGDGFSREGELLLCHTNELDGNPYARLCSEFICIAASETAEIWVATDHCSAHCRFGDFWGCHSDDGNTAAMIRGAVIDAAVHRMKPLATDGVAACCCLLLPLLKTKVAGCGEEQQLLDLSGIYSFFYNFMDGSDCSSVAVANGIMSFFGSQAAVAGEDTGAGDGLRSKKIRTPCFVVDGLHGLDWPYDASPVVVLVTEGEDAAATTRTKRRASLSFCPVPIVRPLLPEKTMAVVADGDDGGDGALNSSAPIMHRF
ncbi:hypothetical protein ACLOJK_018443 [Asimina triloba]